MKKVAFLCCLFCGLITQAVGATYNCKPQSLGPLAFKSSNEYLFSVASRYDDKIALVCGHKGTDGCKDGTIVRVYDKHYYRGVEIDQDRLYRCDTSGGASWEHMSLADLDECANTDGLWPFRGLGWEDYDFYKNGAVDVDGGWVFDGEPCYVFVGDDDPSPVVTSSSGIVTVVEESEDGIVINFGDDLLAEVSAEGTSIDVEESGDGIVIYFGDDPSPESSEEKKTDTTKASETTSAQDAKQNQPAQTKSGDAGENAEGKWREPCSKEDLLKVPHATAGRYIYRTKNELVCAATACEDGYYLVRNENRESQGWCQKGTDPYATTNASETTSEQGVSSSDASGTGATGADATGAGTSGAGTSTQNQPGGGTSGQAQPTAPVVNKSPCDLNQSGWLVFEGECIPEKQYQNILAERQAAKVRALAQKIESTASQLDSMSSKFKVSVWKDAEGKFNTARLASDSIAGVVLGTAGGLITSHVVKKNQVENGFQDIKCTIGGQSVANWGDEFSVGIQ